MKYFTADTHFFHENIIKFCGRPYMDAHIMNQELIHNWNSVVTDKDEVFHLGDVSFGNKENTLGILGQLNGKKYLVPGNHDNVPNMKSMFHVLPQYYELKENHRKIVLCHFPIEQFRGNFHLHGHSHGTASIRYKRRDVGVDCYNFTPVSLDDLILELEKDNTPVTYT